MRFPSLLLAALVVPSIAAAQATVVPRAGLVIDHSVRIRPGVYRLAAPASTDSALIVIRGDDVTVDMRGVTLEGLDPAADPDRAVGVALRIEGGRKVTLRGAHIRGYKVALLARGTRGLTLLDNDVSYNWKPRLYSLVEHESLVDWLSFHHNEKGEWMRFGSAIFLEDVRGGEIRGNRAVQGMNALMLTRSDSLRIWNNDFSFNSGLGIGLYRSSDNTIVHNRVDYDVRGYSHGHYRRGQDSAGLLIFEQSSHNTVAFNSITHGGDGLFLWAGQQTMDSGTGGANDNLFYANDFSFAPTNGMEATFSRNSFIYNRIAGSDHGLWGGYSYDSPVLYNWFDGNRIGIAIEHGQTNRIEGNVFSADSTDVYLWANAIEPSDWGYPKHRDTRSHGYQIARNVFDHARVGLRILNTSESSIRDNSFVAIDTVQVLKDTSGLDIAGNRVLAQLPPGVSIGATLPDSVRARMPKPLRGAIETRSALAAAPRAAIVVDEWGPYDYQSPKLWPVDSSHGNPQRLAVLGPPGRWTVASLRGIASVTPRSGIIRALGASDTITVTPRADSSGSWEVTLRYSGAATTTARGERHAAGAPVLFSYRRFEPTIDWATRWYAWSDSTDPRTHAEAFDRLLTGPPLLAQPRPRLDYEGYGTILKGLPNEHVALEATGTVDLPQGDYTLRTISDDAVRVWVDDRLTIDAWTPHESEIHVAPLHGGRHTLRVRYYQVDGWFELRLDIVRGLVSAASSPGPH